MHCRRERGDILGGGDRDHVDRTPPLPKAAEDVDAGHVRQVDVEQDEVRLEPGREVEGLVAGPGDANDLEATDLLGVEAMQVGDPEVVVDDECPDHRALAGARRPASAPAPAAPGDGCPGPAAERGSLTLKSAPPSFRIAISPPWRLTTCWTRARPSPRIGWEPGSFVVKPSSKIRSTLAGATPGPESPTRMSTPPSLTPPAP